MRVHTVSMYGTTRYKELVSVGGNNTDKVLFQYLCTSAQGVLHHNSDKTLQLREFDRLKGHCYYP